MTILVGVAFAMFLPRDTQHTTGMLSPARWDVFNDRERHILSRRVILDDHYKKQALSFISVKEVLTHLVNYRLWIHASINIMAIAPKGALQTYSPTIIKNLGFDRTAANALNSVGAYGVIVIALTLAWLSDKTRKRALWCVVSMCYCIVFAGTQYAITTHNDKWVRYAVLMLLNSGNAVAQSLNDAWLSCNARSPTERSIGLSLAVIGSNLGGLAGQNLFRENDAPRYTIGFLAIMCLYAGSFIAVLVMWGVYWGGNKKLDKAEAESASSASGNLEDAQSETDNPTRFRYEL